LGRTLELRAEYGPALVLYEDLEAWAAARAKQDLVLASLLARATIRSTANPTFNAGEATALLTKARMLAHTIGDRAAEAKILWNLLLLSTMEGGDPEERLRFGLEALAIARELELRDLIPLILHDLWYAYGSLGRWREALVPLEEVEALPEIGQHLPILAESLTRRSYTHLVLGEYDAARPLAEESYRLGALAANLEGMSISRSFIGLVYLDRGEIDRGLALMEQAVELGRQVGGVTAIIGTQAELGWAYGWLGDVERGQIRAKAAGEFDERHMVNLLGWALAPLARLHLLAGDIAPAEAALNRIGAFPEQRRRMGFVPYMWIAVGLAQAELALAKADFSVATEVLSDMIAQLHRDGLRFRLADAHYLRGRVQLARGDRAAEGDLRQAEAIAREIGDNRILWSILSARSDLLAASDPPAAAALRVEGDDITSRLAGTIGDLGMRERFLDQTRRRGLDIKE
jgi:tetratricopeptide (TPR) repeat protein